MSTLIIKKHDSADGVEAAGASAFTVGIFDGVHRGHKKILDALRRIATEKRLVASVWSFSVSSKAGASSLISPAHREMLLSQAGVDSMHYAEFGPFAGMSAGNFLRKVLVGRLGAKAIVIGEGARLGRGRETGAEEFLAMASALGLKTWLVEHEKSAGTDISSTRIRNAVASGELKTASTLLGYTYGIMGAVEKGLHLGTGLGFPTANLGLSGLLAPPYGVYAAEAMLEPDSGSPDILQAAAYIGDRPVLGAEGGAPVMEVHIPGWKGDLYGRTMLAMPLRFVRPQRAFGSKEELREQIGKDVSACMERPK